MDKTPMQALKYEVSTLFNTDKVTKTAWWKAWPEWGLILLVVLIFSHGILDLGTGQALPGSEAESFELGDQVLVNSIHSYHQFPQWNPYILGGTPYVADPMFHAFNPFVTLPVLYWGTVDGYMFALFLSILLAAYGAWWLAKTAGMGPAGRVWSACLFAFAGQPAIRFLSGEYLLVFGFAWIPWSFASLINLIQTRRKVYVIMSVISLGMLFFSGNAYYAAYMLIFIGLLGLIFIPRFQRKMPYVHLDSGKVKILVVTGILAFGLVAVQALPLFEFYPRMNKDRSQSNSQTLQQMILDFTSTKIGRPDARNLPAQEYYAYLGWGPLAALLLLPLAFWKHPNKRAIIFFGALLVLTILMIDLDQMPWKDFIAKISFLAQFHLPTRALIYCGLAVILLSGFVIDTLWKLPSAIRQQRLIKLRGLIISTTRVGLAAVMIFFLFITFHANVIFLHTYDPLAPLTDLMEWLRQTDTGVYYVDVFKDFPMSAVYNNLWLLDPWYHFSAPTKGEPTPRPVNAYPQYLLTGTVDPIPYPDPVQIKVSGVYSIFKLPHSLPYAFTVSDDRFNDPTNTGELTNEDVIPAQVQLGGTDRMTIIASGDSPGTLVVLTTLYPGWRVSVNGQSKRLLNIGGRIGVKLMSGTHTYEFTFRSTTFIIGLWISVITLLVLAGLLASEWQSGLRKGSLLLQSAFEYIGSWREKISPRRPQRFSAPPMTRFSPDYSGTIPATTEAIIPTAIQGAQYGSSGFFATQAEAPLKSKTNFSRSRSISGTSRLALGLAQINTRLGDVHANLEKHLALTKQARQDGMDLLVFPELSLTGYVLQDLVPAVSCRPESDDPVFHHLLDASRDIDLTVGFVDEDARHRFFIASAYLSQGEVVHVHHKIYLPTYGLFDEGRFFAPGDSVRAFDTRFGRFGMLICEDFWHASPPYILWQDGADLLLFSSASPGRGLNGEPKLESSAWVEHINRAYASLFTIFVAHANRSGFEDGLNFWGGSTVFDPNGKLLVQASYFEESLTTAEIDLNQLHRTRARLPLLRDERPELVEHELERILHGH